MSFKFSDLGNYELWFVAPQLEARSGATPFWVGTRPAGTTWPGTGTETHLSITVGGKECEEKEYVEPHTKVKCKLPAGYGLNQTVTVSRRGAYIANGRYVSYAGPVISTGTLHKVRARVFAIAGPHLHGLVVLQQGEPVQMENGVAVISYDTTTADGFVVFEGRNFGTNISEVTVYYG